MRRVGLVLMTTVLTACAGSEQPLTAPAPGPEATATSAQTASPAQTAAGDRAAVSLEDARKALPRELVEGMPEGMTVRAGMATTHGLEPLQLRADGKEAAFASCITHDEAGAAEARAQELLRKAGWTVQSTADKLEAHRDHFHLVATLQRGKTKGSSASAPAADVKACALEAQVRVAGVVTATR